jgi:hypothetical protein
MRSYVANTESYDLINIVRVASDLRRDLEREFAKAAIDVEVTRFKLAHGHYLVIRINEDETNTASQDQMQKVVRSAGRQYVSNLAELAVMPSSNKGEVKDYFNGSVKTLPDDVDAQIQRASKYFGIWAPSAYANGNHAVESSSAPAPVAHA